MVHGTDWGRPTALNLKSALRNGEVGAGPNTSRSVPAPMFGILSGMLDIFSNEELFGIKQHRRRNRGQRGAAASPTLRAGGNASFV